jgi:hypothetical protein
VGVETWSGIVGLVAAVVAIAMAAISARAARDARRSAHVADRQASAAKTEREAFRQQVGAAERDQKLALARMVESVRLHRLRRLEDEHASCHQLLDAVNSMLRAADQFIDMQDQDGTDQRYESFVKEIALLTPKLYDVRGHAYTDELLTATEKTLTSSYQMLDAVLRVQRRDDATSAPSDYFDALEVLRQVKSDLEQYAAATAARVQAETRHR